MDGGPGGPAPAPAPVSGSFRLDASRYRPVFREKRSFAGRTLVLWLKRGADAGRRAGVVVSKRTFRRAVDRNRAKRLLREAFRLSRGALPSDLEAVLVARAGIGGKGLREVLSDFAAVCRRARVWRGPQPPPSQPPPAGGAEGGAGCAAPSE